MQNRNERRIFSRLRKSNSFKIVKIERGKQDKKVSNGQDIGISHIRITGTSFKLRDEIAIYFRYIGTYVCL